MKIKNTLKRGWSMYLLLLLTLLCNVSHAQLRVPLIATDTLRNYCPIATANLKHALLTNPGYKQSVQWYSNPARTGAVYSSPEAATVGTYYAFLYDSLSTSYSGASQALVVSIINCSTKITYATTECNALIPLTDTRFNNLQPSITNSGVCLGFISQVADNMTNASLTDAAAYTFGVGVGCSAIFRVKSTSDTYKKGSFAGFKISTSGLLGASVAKKIVVSIYKTGTSTALQQETVLDESIALNPSLLSSDGTGVVGFIANYDYDEIRITFTSLISAASTSSVYYAVIGKYCEGPDLRANVLTPMNNNIFPTRISTERSGLLCTACSLSGGENVVSPSKTDFATITSAAGLANSTSLSVKDVVTIHDENTFAGFTIAKPSILNLELLNSITLTAYRNGLPVGSSSGASLLSLGSSLLGGANKHLFGFIPGVEFDELQITVSGLVGALNTINVYEAVFQRFEDKELENCNTLTSLVNPDYPMAINPARTGIIENTLGLCVPCGVGDTYNALNETENDYSTINIGVSVLGVKGSYSVKNQVGNFPENTYAGFEIENTSILDLSILQGITVKAFRNDTLVGTSSGPTQLVSLNLLGSNLTGKNIIGFVPDEAFDEIVLEVAPSPLLSAQLGTTRIYRAVAMPMCTPTLSCDSTYALTQPDFPVSLNLERTGVSGLVCGLTSVVNPGAVISADTTDAATITLPVGVGCSGAVSVKSYNSLYPAGSTASFKIKTQNNFLQLDLLAALSIELYRNDTLVKAGSVGSLLNIELLGILSSDRTFKLSMRSDVTFDEIRFVSSSLASALNPILVYGAFVDTKGSFGGVLQCCSVNDFRPTVTSTTAANFCPSEEVNLSGLVSSTCPYNTEIQWHNTSSGFSASTLVNNAIATSTGTYHAVCYDSLVNCYSLASSNGVAVTITPCCPTISNNTSNNTSPSVCGGANGTITICGLIPNKAGYEVRYTKVGSSQTVLTNLTANNSGCLVLSGLSAGQYNGIVVFHADCSSSSNNINVTLSDPPAPSFPTGVSASVSTACVGQNVTLNATCSGGTPAWFTDAALNNPVTSSVTLTAPTIYYVICQLGTCNSSSQNVSVGFTASPTTPTITTDKNIVCGSETATLTGSCSVGTLTWSNSSTGNSIQVSAGTYTATCVNSCGASTSSNTISITGFAAPTGLSASQNAVCSQESTSLQATCAQGNVVWFSDAGLLTQISNQVTPLVQTTYYAVCKTAECQSAATPIIVQPNTTWINGDCDGDGVTNGDEMTSSGTSDPVTDHLNGCEYNEAEQVFENTSAAWKAQDCDDDGNPNGTDPNPKVAVAQNDVLTANINLPATVNILANDDFLPGANTSITRLTGIAGGTAGGTVVFDPITGEMTYTALMSESVTNVTVVYNVCNTAANPDVCASATVTISVQPAGDSDGDGEPDNTDPAPNDGCVYSASHTPTIDNTSSAWKAQDCDGDGVTNGDEMTSSGTSDPVTDHLDGCEYNEAEQVPENTSAAWKAQDCDDDGNPNGTDPNPKVAVAQNDILTANINIPATVNVLANDDFLSGANTSITRLAGGTAGGTVVFDPLTGEMTYTALMSESATNVTVVYNVCNTAANPDVCASATVTISVQPAGDSDGDGEPDNTDPAPSDGCVYSASHTPTIANTSAAWKSQDCDGDGVTNGDEITSSGTSDPVTDHLNGCEYNEAEQVLENTSAAWKAQDCDDDGNPNGTDPNPKVAVAQNDGLTANINIPATVNILANDDFLSGANTSITRLAGVAGGTAGGTVVFDPLTGEMTYTALMSESATTVTVVYNVCNTAANPDVCASATVTISVQQAGDSDGDGEPDNTDPAPTDGCVYSASHTPTVSNTSSAWKAQDCDGDGVTNGDEMTSSGTSDPVTDHLNGCEYNEAEQVFENTSAAWKAQDCDDDGNPNGTDPNPKVAVAQNDVLTASINIPATVNVLANDDFLPGANTSITRLAGVAGGTAGGTVVFDPLTGEMTYTALMSESATNVTLVYNVCNTAANPDVCATATVTISVQPAGDSDGDGEPDNTDPAPSDGCVYSASHTPTIANTSSAWKAQDCDGDGVTNGDEMTSSGTSDPVTDHLDGCEYNEAEQVPENTSAAWKAQDCDDDGNPNGTDPNPKVAVAQNDVLTANINIPATVNILANDDFLPGANTSITRLAGVAGGTAGGTVVFDPLTGEMTYTALMSESATNVTVVYNVCNTAADPDVCATATVTISVQPAGVELHPDYNPSISVLPHTGLVNGQQVLLRVEVKEVLNHFSDGSSIRVVIPKVPQFSFNWQTYALATDIPSVMVTGLKNADWTFSEDPVFWIWTYNKPVFNALHISHIGLLGTWNAGSSNGKTNFTATIINGSGGEVNFINNVDQEVVNFNVNP